LDSSGKEWGTVAACVNTVVNLQALQTVDRVTTTAAITMSIELDDMQSVNSLKRWDYCNVLDTIKLYILPTQYIHVLPVRYELKCPHSVFMCLL
jgi:hypothetical protein